MCATKLSQLIVDTLKERILTFLSWSDISLVMFWYGDVEEGLAAVAGTFVLSLLQLSSLLHFPALTFFLNAAFTSVIVFVMCRE